MPAKSNSDVALLLKEKVANENKKDRQGDNRSKLYYLEAPYGATKLDDIFGPENWSLEITKQESRVWEQTLISFARNQREPYQARVASASVTARLTVTFPDGRKKVCDGIGAGDAIRRLDNPNCVETEGLALKAAATDALKRAATLLGNIFGRGMERDGTQRYDYDYVPPEDDDADPGNRPTAPIEAESIRQPLHQDLPPSSRLQAAPQPSSQPQARPQPTQQPQGRQQQYREPVVTSGHSRQVANDAPPTDRSQSRTGSQGHQAPADDFEAALGHSAATVQQADDDLSRHLRLIIPQGSLLQVGAPDKWRDIFIQLNEARKSWVTTADHVTTIAGYMADFRKRATAENIITGNAPGARDIKNYFDTMDAFVEKKRKEILGIGQAA